MMEFLASTHGSQGTPQTVEAIILLIVYFQGPTEV